MAKSANVHLIVGNDDATVFRRGTEEAHRLAGPSPDAFAFDVYEERDTGPNCDLIYGAMRSVKSPPFLGGVKTVWLKHFSGLDAESAKSSELGKAVNDLAEFISRGIPPDIILIIDGVCKDSKKLKFLKTCKDKANIIELNRPDRGKFNWEAAMADIIAEAARKKGVDFQKEALDYFIGVLGTDIARIDTELEKLICYRGEPGTLTLDDVAAVCTGQGEEFSWSFTNALGDRNISDCLRIIDTMSQDHAKPSDVIARTLLLASAGHFRQSLQLQIFMNQNRISNPAGLRRLIETATPEQKQEWKQEGMDFVNFHPFRVQKMAEKAVTYHPREIIRAITAIRDALWQCNSSSTEARSALESVLFAIVPRPRTAQGRP